MGLAGEEPYENVLAHSRQMDQQQAGQRHQTSLLSPAARSMHAPDPKDPSFSLRMKLWIHGSVAGQELSPFPVAALPAVVVICGFGCLGVWGSGGVDLVV